MLGLRRPPRLAPVDELLAPQVKRVKARRAWEEPVGIKRRPARAVPCSGERRAALAFSSAGAPTPTARACPRHRGAEGRPPTPPGQRGPRGRPAAQAAAVTRASKWSTLGGAGHAVGVWGDVDARLSCRYPSLTCLRGSQPCMPGPSNVCQQQLVRARLPPVVIILAVRAKAARARYLLDRRRAGSAGPVGVGPARIASTSSLGACAAGRVLRAAA